MDEENKTNELTDSELDDVAGGGTYTKDGYLKTTIGYSCDHFECKYCGRKFRSGIKTHMCSAQTYYDDYSHITRMSQLNNNCNNCKYHSTLKCSNPLNKR